MQPSLPLITVGKPHVLCAHGAHIDFVAQTIQPAHFVNVGNLLGRIVRYGVMRSLRWERCCTVLFHSALVGRIAQELASGGHLNGVDLDLAGPLGLVGWGSPPVQRLVGLYGALHDVGEIFGGDITVHVPEHIRKSLQTYQSDCRNQVMLDLGFPLPSPALRAVIQVADHLAVCAEKKILLDSTTSSDDWLIVLQDRMDRLGIIGVDVESFGAAVMKKMGVEDRFPTHNKALSMWKRLIRAELVLLSNDGIVVGVAERSDLPAVPRKQKRVQMTFNWISGFGVDCDGAHDFHSLRQGGKVLAWEVSIGSKESAA